ncbi:hypothetical protein Nepgr_012333 [Nepenthes gracilis]|uniref:Uncharacterized protein n=1 Tax=Nepenthes gracilis TaxID=150966 RepID=A0AAD3SFY6_NEPGR|nr:hypothetical protein Nepgr_012333 [Nepenthes gracilis]
MANFILYLKCMVYFPRPFPWGKPSFHLEEAVAMMAASLIALTEVLGALLNAAFGSVTDLAASIMQFNVTVAIIFMSSSVVATLVGLSLNNTVEHGKVARRKDNGAH